MTYKRNQFVTLHKDCSAVSAGLPSLLIGFPNEIWELVNGIPFRLATAREVYVMVQAMVQGTCSPPQEAYARIRKKKNKKQKTNVNVNRLRSRISVPPAASGTRCSKLRPRPSSAPYSRNSADPDLGRALLPRYVPVIFNVIAIPVLMPGYCGRVPRKLRVTISLVWMMKTRAEVASQ